MENFETTVFKNSSSFTETQHFQGKKIFQIFICIALGILAAAAVSWFLHIPFVWWILLIIGTILLLVFTILYFVFANASLTVTIDATGVAIQWKTIGNAGPKLFPWNKIESIQKAANPRPGKAGNSYSPYYGQLYTMFNMEGIQLVTKDGKRIFIGSKQTDKAINVSKKYFHTPS